MSSKTLNMGVCKPVYLAQAYRSHTQADGKGGRPNHSQPPCLATTTPSDSSQGLFTFSSWTSRQVRSRSARSLSSTWQATSPLKCSSASSVVKSAIWNGEGYNRVTRGRRATNLSPPRHPSQDPPGINHQLSVS